MTLAKIAVLGCGRPSRRWHLPTLAELATRGRIEFVARCDLDLELAARMGRAYAATRHEQMLHDDFAEKPGRAIV